MVTYIKISNLIPNLFSTRQVLKLIFNEFQEKVSVSYEREHEISIE